MNDNQIINFIRKRDYRLVKKLGQGACGETVLLHDDYINEGFVCKKYLPHCEEERETLFNNFVREVCLLHRVFHPNIVRVFNYYLYPDSFAGYIIMEHIDGNEIDKALKLQPEIINEVFIQAVSGFKYLESHDILHRDIRTTNLLIDQDGSLKIIDFGFGKQIEEAADFDKSISLNWWCEPPKEFKDSIYDFTTEVYFVGKLFEAIIKELEIDTFNYNALLNRMCQRDPAHRISSFFDVDKEIQSNKFLEIDFSEEERYSYVTFSDLLSKHITKIESRSRYQDDVVLIEKEIEDVYRSIMLEINIPDASVLLSCFIKNTYYLKSKGFPVSAVKDFIHLLKSSGMEKKRIILANLHRKMDSIPRYTPELTPPDDDEVPF